MPVTGGLGRVTADPPRTQLWCLLYAQVRQADNKDFRNILLDDKQLDWRLQVERDPNVNRFLKYDDLQLRTLKNLTIRNFKDELSYAGLEKTYKLVDPTTQIGDLPEAGIASERIRMLQERRDLVPASPRER